MNTRLHSDIGFLLSCASGRIVRGTNAALAPTGLRARAYAVLLLLCEQPAGLTQRVIAESLDLDPSQIVALVRDLEHKGLVTRTMHPTDRRNNLICSTKQGRRVLGTAAQLTASFYTDTLGHLSPRHTSTLRRTLTAIVLDDDPGDPVDHWGPNDSPLSAVERAVGVLMLVYGIPAGPAFDLLVRRAQDTDAALGAVAEQIVAQSAPSAGTVTAIRREFDPLLVPGDSGPDGKETRR
jgi:DNA-binding MarR family transcriptional regulator